MFFAHFTRNVWLLCLAQVFAFTGINVTVFLGGIIGSLLTPTAAFATFPVVFMVVGTAIGTAPAAMLMSKYGRRFGFMSSAIVASGSALLGAYAIYIQHFWIYSLACCLMGLSIAYVQQYRFAAAESVAPEHAPQAISAILLSSIAGAFLGPNVANISKDLFTDAQFVGSYIALALMVLLPAIILYWLKDTIQPPSNQASSRSMKELAQQPNFILAVATASISYGLMSFLMTATPISMHIMDGHSLYHTGLIIQWHIVSMFLPSLFTGKLIVKWGYNRIMIAGITSMLGCIITSQFHQSVMGYWVSLVLLGMCWNLLFVTGTALLVNCYRDNEKYRAQALNDFIVFGFQALASLSAGWLLIITSWSTINLITMPLILVLLMTILWCHQRHKQASTHE